MKKLKGKIFIVGASRSGTTLLARILDMHPDIYTMNELHYFGDLFEFVTNRENMADKMLIKIASKLFARYKRGLWNDHLEENDIKSSLMLINGKTSLSGSELFHLFIEHVANDNSVSLVAEQTPRNIYYASDILEAYPDAKLIHIVRDPRAVIASQKKRWLRRKTLNAKNIPTLEMIREWISYHPFTMTLLWKKAFKVGPEVMRSNRYMQLRFEDLVNHPTEVIYRICDFLNVSFVKKMLQITQLDSSVRTTDNTKVGIQKTAVDSWKKVLTVGEVSFIERRLSTEMEKIGYHDKQSKEGAAFFSFLRLALWFPFHMLGTFLINPQRFLIQIKGAIIPMK